MGLNLQYDPTTGVVTFDPANNFNGTATLPYSLCDNSTPTPLCSSAVIQFTVTAVNDAPVANNDTVVTPLTEDGANGVVNILGNDTDADGNPTPTSGHTVDLDPTTPGVNNTITTPQGTWTFNPTTGEVTFDPANNPFSAKVFIALVNKTKSSISIFLVWPTSIM